ncbi:MAG: cytochrome c oxidase subunit II [Clostridia bacterium]|nr:cytochrome c oxidase subunit II [Clostridia bacterium]
MFAAILYSAYGLGLHVEGNAGQVDPATALQTRPFNRPGLHRTGPDTYELVMVARAWSFTPARVDIPAGAEVTFRITSVDVVHGFRIPGTTVNAMLVPGQVTVVRHRFTKAGTYTFFCHEYCGNAHHVMAGTLRVTDRPVAGVAATGAAATGTDDPDEDRTGG